MKKSVIKQMLNGERGHCELIKNSEKYYELLGEVIKNDDILRKKLTGEFLILYDKFKDAIEHAHCEEIDAYYIEGFKFGFLFGLEIAEE